MKNALLGIAGLFLAAIPAPVSAATNGSLRGSVLVERPAASPRSAGELRYGGPPSSHTNAGAAEDRAEAEANRAHDAGEPEKNNAMGVVFLRSAQRSKESSRRATAGGRDETPAVLDQRNKTFVPHLLVIRVGDTVRFPNSDPVYHNVFSYSKAKAFDLGRYPRGRSRSVRFEKPGIVEVFCDIHSNMNAFIVILENDHYGLLDASGNYSIENIPPGSWEVTAWVERKPVVRKTVTIAAGSPSRLDFRIP